MAKSKAINSMKMKSGKDRQTENVANQIVVSRGVGMPRQYRTKLRFAYNTSLAITGVTSVLAFGCNSPQQPNRTLGTTETPAYYTRLAALYDRVYTNGSTIRLEVVNTTTADGVQVVLSNDGTAITSAVMFDQMERTGAVSHMLGHYSGGDAKVTLGGSWTPKPFIGVRADSPDNAVVNSTDPPNIYFWLLFIQSIAAGSGNVAVQIIMEYDVTFSELSLPY